MRFLYIFPHPDDESFGPAAPMAQQLRQGHEVHLLTLTKGGATKVRHTLGLSIEEMGEVRYREMLEVEKVLGLTSMTVLDLPDSGMKEMDPREIERVVAEQIQRLQPNIIVSYPVHGISGFEDHLVMHAVAKRVFLELRDQGHAYLKRLAFYTLGPANTDIEASIFPLKRSKMEEIDCVVEVSDQDAEQMRNGLRCYVSYAEVIAKSKVMEVAGGTHYFEFYQEQFQPPVTDITEGL